MYMWLLCIRSQPLLGLYARAVLAGLASDDEDSNPYSVYVGRYGPNQQYTPAKIVASLPTDGEGEVHCVEAQVPLNGSVLVVDDNFEVLVILEGGSTVWMPVYSGDHIPSDAVPVGESSSREELYFGRIVDFPFNGTTCVGKICPSEGRFYYPHKDGEERSLDISELEGSLEVLTIVPDGYDEEGTENSTDMFSCAANFSSINIKSQL